MTAKHQISNAKVLTRGDLGYKPYMATKALESRRGVIMSDLYAVQFGAVDTLDADGLIKAATSTELPDTETVTYTFATDGGTSPLDGANTTGVLDVPRNITAAASHGSSVVAMTIVVTGTDEYGMTMVEQLSIAATGTSQTDAGKKAFKIVTTIAITAASDAEANTLNMGWGDVLGLPFRLSTKGQIVSTAADGSVEDATIVVADTTDPATATDGDVRGTVDFTQASDGTIEFTALMVRNETSDITEMFGVAQYSG